MTDSTLSPEILREVEEIRLRYIGTLHEKVTRLIELKAICESSDWDTASLAGLKYLTHQLAGSLGIHALDHEQSSAETLDDALDSGGHEPEALAKMLDDLVQLLRSR